MIKNDPLKLTVLAAFLGTTAMWSTQAYAACDNITPANSAAVICTGIDNIGISGGADNVTVTVNGSGLVDTVGMNAIALGSGANITIESGSTVQSNQTGISIGGGDLFLSGALSGTASAATFGAAGSTLHLFSTPSITGTVDATTSGSDTLRLRNTGNYTFNADNIGTQYLGFETFRKDNGGTWTITGTGAQDWTVSGGTLEGTTTSIQGNISNSGTLQFNQAANGTYAGVVSGTGGLSITGNGRVNLTGANTYTGGTIVSAGVLQGDTTSLQGNIVNNSEVSFLQNSNGTYSNIISGTGSLTKDGTGSLTLSGNNTYTGGTIINGGTLFVTTNSLSGNVINNSQLRFSQNSDGIYTGTISGSGQIRKYGSGNVTLTGNNTHTGFTRINSGTLTVSADENLGAVGGAGLRFFGGALKYGASFDTARNVSLGASGTIDTNGFNSTLSGVLSGSGGLIKRGTGRLTLSGVNTYTGATTVNAGRLEVSNTIASSDTTIALGGELSGTGTVGNLVNNGTLAPGNSIATLNVTGNLAFNAGSTYTVEVDDAGNSGNTITTGNITINGGTFDVQAASGSYGTSTNYTILQGAAVSGTFDSVTSNFAFLTPSLTYNATDVELTLDRNDVSFASLTSDPSQVGIASAAEDLGTGNVLYDAITSLNTEQATQAFQSLSAEHNVNLGHSVASSSNAVRSLVFNRVQNISPHSGSGHNITALRAVDSPASGSVDSRRLSMKDQELGNIFSRLGGMNASLWTEVLGTKGRSDAQGAVASQARESAGFIMGGDILLDAKTTIGFFGGLERAEIYTDSQNANSDIDSVHFGGYGSYSPFENWRISSGLNGAFHDIDTVRSVAFTGFQDTAYGETEGYTISSYIEGAHTYDTGYAAFEPYAALNITHSNVNGYSESSTSGAALTVDTDKQSIISHETGLRVGKTFFIRDGEGNNNLSFQGKIGWKHIYSDVNTISSMRFTQGNSQFNVQGLDYARNTLMLGTSVEAQLADKADIYVSYNGEMSKDHRDHAMTLGVKWSF